MKNRIISLVIVLSLILTISLSVFTAFAEGTAKPGSDEMPYIDFDASISKNSGYDGIVNAYSGEEAVAAGVPAGYSGYVLRVQPDSNGAYAGCCFDFGEQSIPIDYVEAITFRVYLPTGHSEMRMTGPGTSASWIMRQTPSSLGAWCDITLSADGTGFQSGVSMANMANSQGNLGAFCLIGRMGSSSDNSYYLDSITVKLKAGSTDDKTPPVINYEGPKEVNAYVGEIFTPTGLTAFDEFDKASAPIIYEWSEGAVDSLGALREGTHTCRVVATDRSGNKAELVITVTAKVDHSIVILDSIPTCGYIEGVSIYDGTVTELRDNATAGLPEGFSGRVTKVSSSGNRFGFTFDPSSLDIPVGIIERITIRMYLLSSASGNNTLRISNRGSDEWFVLADPQSGAWVEYALGADGYGFTSDYNRKISDLGGEGGGLAPFGISVKYPSSYSGEYYFLIDSITLKLKKDDGAAPVLNYEGEKDIVTSAGKPFVSGILAFDEQQMENIEPTYSWSEGAIDENGLLLEGEHTCTVSASDYYGNTSSITLNVRVEPRDTTAPEVRFYPEDVYVLAGSFAMLDIIATDDYDRVEVKMTWSEGALDKVGRLLVGEHTLTLECTDLTGNRTTRIIRVHVLTTDYTVGELIECGKR